MEEIYTLLKKYVQSINECNLELARSIWDTEGSVSYIHSKGSEQIFEDIKNNIYTKILNEPFLKREFQIKDIATKYYGNTAFIEFSWEFYAIQKDSKQEYYSKGKETQFIVLRDSGWKLSSIHNSKEY